MELFKMKYFGSAEGIKTKKTYHFDKDQEIEAPKGEFDKETGVIITTDQEIEAPKDKFDKETDVIITNNKLSDNDIASQEKKKSKVYKKQ